MVNRHRSFAVVIGVFLTLIPGASSGQLVGPEFPVSSGTETFLLHPAVAADSNGGFVVTWQGPGQYGYEDNLLARRFDSDGNPLGGDFQVNTYTQGEDSYPAIAANAAGDFVVIWKRYEEIAGTTRIHARWFDPSGAPTGSEVDVNLPSDGMQLVRPSAAAGGNGNFILVWGYDSGYGTGVYARRFDASGAPLGDEFQVNANTADLTNASGVAADTTGGFVVVWSGSNYDVWGRRFDSSGQPLADEFRVNTHTTGHQSWPAVAMTAAGDFVVAWYGPSSDGTDLEVFAQRFDAAATPVGPEFQVNAYTTGEQLDPSVAVTGSGGFVVSWISENQDSSDFGVFGQQFDASGAPVGAEFRINSTTQGTQWSPAVAALPDNGFIVAWEGEAVNGFGDMIFGQRVAEAVFAGDFESGDACDWSGSTGGGSCP